MRTCLLISLIAFFSSAFAQTVHISANTSVVNVTAGQSQQVLITITPSGGFNQQLFFTANPSGTSYCFSSANFSVNPVIYPYTNGDTLTISASSTAIPAQCTMEVWATNGPALSDTIALQVNIIANNCYFTNISSLFGTYGPLLANQNGVWIGGTSLYKYAGANSIDYHQAQGISDIAEDSQHTLWMSTSNGVVKFDGTYWSNYNSSNTNFPIDQFSSIAIDSSDHVWVTPGNYFNPNFGDGIGHGLISFDGITWTTYDSLNTPLPSSRFRNVAFDRNGLLWVSVFSFSTNSFNIYNFDGTNWTLVNPSNCLPLNYMSKIYFDSQNNAWFGINPNGNSGLTSSQIGLIKFTTTSTEIWCDSSLRPFNHIKFDMNCNVITTDSSSKIPGLGVRSVYVDHLDRIWTGSFNEGIAIFDGTTFTNYNSQNSLLSDNKIYGFSEYNNIMYYTVGWGSGTVEYGYYSCGNITGVNEITKNNFTIYPNPTTGEINILSNTNGNKIDFRIYDMTGKLVFMDAYANPDEKIQLFSLHNGIYEFVAFDGEQQYSGRITLVK